MGTMGTAGTTATTPHAFSDWSGMSRLQVINKLHEMIYILINDSNIAAHLVRNSRLWDVIEFAVHNGKQLAGAERSALQMGRYKYNSIQAVSFWTMVNTIERLVSDTKAYFRRFTTKTVPCIYIGHDMWDGKNKSVLGLCIFIVSPLLKEMVVIPVALQRSSGKDAADVAKQALAALER
jgi:hypothetical protein